MWKWARAVGAVALATLGLGSGPALCADAAASILFSNAYIWRGITFNDSGVTQFSVDVSEDVGSQPLSFNVWGNMDLGDFDGERQSGRLFEVDLTLTLGLPAGFAVGYIEYIFPTQVTPNNGETAIPGTRELFVGWSKDLVVSPAVTFYYDVDAIDSYYTTFSLGWNRPLSDRTSFDVGALAGLAGENFAVAAGGTKGGFFNYDLSAAVSHRALDKLGISGAIGWAGTFDKAVLPEQPLGFYFAAGLNVDF